MSEAVSAIPLSRPISTGGPAGSPPPPGPRRVLNNFLHLASGKAAAGVVSAIYLIIVTRALGVHDYGVLILVNAYAVLVGTIVAFCGFHNMVRWGAIALESGDTAGFARIARYMTVVELAFGIAAVALCAALAPLIGPRLGWSADTIKVAVLYSLSLISQIRATPQGVLQIAGRFDLISAHQIVQPGVRLIGALGVMACGGGLNAYLAVWFAAGVLEGAAMWLMAAGAWRSLAGGERLFGPWRGVAGAHGGFMRFMLITKAEITLRELAPKLAPVTVGWVLGPAAAGAFSLALRATSLLAQPAQLLSRAIYPVLALQNARGQAAPLWRTVWTSAALATATAIPIVGLLGLFGDRLLPLLGGKTFAGGALLVMLIAVSRVVTITGAPIAAGLIALGRPGPSMVAALVANLGLFPLMPVLMLKLGEDGAGWHALIQSLLATGLLSTFFILAWRSAGSPEPIQEAVGA